MAVSTLETIRSTLDQPIEVTSGLNINNLTDAGVYRASSSVASSLTNKPTNDAFVMLVIRRSAGYEKNQIVFTANSIYLRGSVSGSFSGISWYKIQGTEMT